MVVYKGYNVKLVVHEDKWKESGSSLGQMKKE